ncbi:UbiA family prenyltransferase [Candidatus Woesearchaeota archaeon]|nr:UbiA family prenyltransferase [Candidatus Woesearchaeota archaeon]
MSRLWLLVRISRPLSWPLVALLFGLGLAISGAAITATAILQLLLVAILLPLIVFGINDVYDCRADAINKRKQSAIHGFALEEVHHRFVSSAALASTIGLAIFSAFTRNPGNMVATAIVVSLGWAYSEPPIRLKEKPVLDSLSNGALVLSVILMGYSYGAPVTAVPATVYFAAFCASAIHALGAIMDYSPDKKAGVTTIATFFGKRLTAALALALVLAIILFSGIKSPSLRMFFWYAAVAFGILAVKDDERLAKRLFGLGFLIALTSIAIFVYQQFFK